MRDAAQSAGATPPAFSAGSTTSLIASWPSMPTLTGTAGAPPRSTGDCHSRAPSPPFTENRAASPPAAAKATAAAIPAFSGAPIPLVSRRPRYAHLGCDVGDRATRADPFDQQAPTEDGQPGITVGHEDLRAVSS